MKNVKSMLMLIAVLNGISASGQAADCKVKGLELFPAEYQAEDADGASIRFLSKKPLELTVESYDLDHANKIASLVLSKESAKKFSELTKEYLEKRLAIVVDGQVVSAPVVKAEVNSPQLNISMQNEEGFKKLGESLDLASICSK